VGIDGLRVVVIIPAYRAADTLVKVLGGIPAFVNAIYVGDDASPDETGTRVRAVADPRVKLFVHDVNRGVGDAMVTGYRHALSEGADICVKMDADDQMDPAYLRRLIEPLIARRADYTKGNRFRHGEDLRRMPLVRKVGNAGLSFLIKAASSRPSGIRWRREPSSASCWSGTHPTTAPRVSSPPRSTGAGKPAGARALWEKVLKLAEGYKDTATASTARTRLAQRP
jgi:glycosyltransferase involved in cell wall biosynthesis